MLWVGIISCKECDPTRRDEANIELTFGEVAKKAKDFSFAH
jgi:hypothetical protein